MLITQFANALTQLPNFFELHIVGFRIPRVDRVDFGFQLRKFRDEARSFGGGIWTSHYGLPFAK
jgi:hypothetical protein